MALNVDLDLPFDYTQNWIGTWVKASEINGTKTYITNETSVELSTAVTVV